jgi:hypothetical protein
MPRARLGDDLMTLVLNEFSNDHRIVSQDKPDALTLFAAAVGCSHTSLSNNDQ